MITYKLLRKRKNGTLGPLFINRKQVVPIGEWLTAKLYPTKGYEPRLGWHSIYKPHAPHLTTKNRVWCQVEIKDYIIVTRPESQGGMWYISQKMKVLREL